MDCQYCKKKFVSKHVLATHQKRAKSCLLVQKNINNNVISDLIKCEFCELEMNPKNITRHHNTCIKRFRKIIEEKDNIIAEKTNRIIFTCTYINYTKIIY